MIDYDTITYNEYILNIIATRGQWNIPEGEYFEGHHILPRSCGGTGSTKHRNKNIIWLYPKEHYIAHYLLAKENPNNIKYARAFMGMLIERDGRKGVLLDDAELYSKIKKELSRCAAMNAFAVHANMSAEEKASRYTKSSKSLSKYYAEVDRLDDDWVKRQEQNKQTNVETSKAWRGEFYNLFHRTPESYREYDALKASISLFNEIKDLSEDEQRKAIDDFNSNLKSWRDEFYKIFNCKPESYRKYGLYKDVLQLFKEIRNLSEEEQLEAVKNLIIK